ncbi:MAG: GTPase Era [Armatimonadetes bacterium]|nr:GTPase Era [Armatimonadota bacterium]
MAHKFGTVALIGKPNVGKSTLLNSMVGEKVSIVSNKPQTTRRRVLGILNREDCQIAFVDTPGIHTPHTKLSQSMLGQARAALDNPDLILVVVDGSKHPGEADKDIAKMVKESRGSHPVLVAMNKMDLLKAENVNDFVELYTELYQADDYMLTTAIRGVNTDKLLNMILDRLPEGEKMLPEDEFTDQSTRFMSAELVREKILIATREEIPHATAVMIDDWTEEEDLVRIHATIFVEKASQRGILLGKGGAFIKKIGTEARKEIEALLGAHIFLELHVKVQEGWRMNPRILHELEYDA